MRRSAPRLIAAAAAVGWLAGGCGEGREARLRERAQAALAAGNLEQARDLLERAVDTDAPRAAVPAGNDLGVVYHRLGLEEEAIAAFENARGLDPSLPGPAYNLAVLLHRRGDDTRAAELFREAAEADPSDARPLEYGAALAIGAGQWETAEALLGRALARAPDSARIHAALGVVRLHTGGTSEAVTNLLHALELDGAHAPALFNLGAIHRDRIGDPDGAARYMQQYLARAPDGPRAPAAAQVVEALRAAAPPPEPALPPPEPAPVDVASVPPEPDAAVPSPEPPAPGAAVPAPEPSPESPPKPAPRRPERTAPVRARPRTVDGLLALAGEEAGRGHTAQAHRTCREARILAEQAGDPQAVERILRTAVNLCGDQAGAQYDYGVHLMKRGEPALAARFFRQAVGLAPEWVPAYLGLAETSMRAGQHAAAETALQRARRLDPVNREATWGLAVLYDQHLGRADEAVTAYREFLARYGDDSRAAAARARIVALGEAPGEASAPDPMIRASAREAPAPAARPPEARPRVRNRAAAVDAYNQGTVRHARGDWAAAAAFYTRALEHDDTFAQAHYNLGRVYEAQNQAARAGEAYEASIRLQPGHINSRFNAARIHLEQGNRDRATGQLREILRIDPAYAPAHYLLGLVYAADPGHRDEAVAAFETFLRLSPDDPAAPAVRRWIAGSP